MLTGPCSQRLKPTLGASLAKELFPSRAEPIIRSVIGVRDFTGKTGPGAAPASPQLSMREQCRGSALRYNLQVVVHAAHRPNEGS